MTGRSEEGVNLRITMVLRMLGMGLEVIIKNTPRAGGPPTPPLPLLPSLGGFDPICSGIFVSSIYKTAWLRKKKTACAWAKTLKNCKKKKKIFS